MTRTSQATRAASHLCGAAEIAAMFGVSRQRVQQIVTSRDFPKPEAELDMGRVWSSAKVRAWARKRGRTIHDT